MFVVNFVSLLVSAYACSYAIELALVQDGSASFGAHIELMSDFMEQLVQQMSARYEEFRFAASSFVDKPIPISGYGPYGGWPAIDYCYRLHSPLTDDSAQIVNALQQLRGTLGSGMDLEENPFEGLMFAVGDENVGWTSASHTALGNPIVRVAMLITDDVPHFPTDAFDHVNNFWNYERAYPDGPEGKSIGGFGAHSFFALGYINSDPEEYEELADFFRLLDHQIELTKDEEQRYDYLLAKLGPYPFPNITSPHPGDLSMPCELTEYPTVSQVAHILRTYQVSPIILLADPEKLGKEHQAACGALGMSPGKDCLVQVYKAYLEEMGDINGVVASIDEESVFETILQSVETITDLLCVEATTEDEMTTTDITTADMTTADMTIAELGTRENSIAAEWSVDQEKSTDLSTSGDGSTSIDNKGHTESITESTLRELSSTSRELSSTSRESSSTLTSSITSGINFITSVSEEEMPAVALIVGVTVGAVAGTAAVVGALYAAGIWSGPAQQVLPMTQVDTAEIPLERETAQDITMDMFS